jgi:uncharacterized protein YbbC (DUF1343 family)/CubicO group peptidase (beta-lactamase class C family)
MSRFCSSRRASWLLAVVVAAMVAAKAVQTDGVPARLLRQLQDPARPPGGQAPQRAGAVAGGSMNLAHLQGIDRAVETAIRESKLPGAVVLVGRGRETPYLKAFGRKALEPSAEAMTVDTVFDLASLTKVVATTTSVMMLVEDGRLRLTDRVASYIPEFGRYGKDGVTIRHLLTHTSGLRPDLDLEDEWQGDETAISRATEEVLATPPGEQFTYSDINFLLLGEIVARVSGTPLDLFAENRIFKPLGMRDTLFKPPPSLLPRIAPTERCMEHERPCDPSGAAVLRGVVHDPTARRMGGVAGHAGLFSTASDLARFCRMLLGHGTLGSTRLLSPLSVAQMTHPAGPAGAASLRGLGWDIDSAYSANRGDLFPVGSFGHTGFTGTSIWIDPLTQTFIVFLSNRVHPDGKGDVTSLRAVLANIVAGALPASAVPSDFRPGRWTGEDFSASAPKRRPERPDVLAGIDILEAEGFARLRGKRVGLLTNNTGRSRGGATTIDLLYEASGVHLVVLFSPEHGIRGNLDEAVPSVKDEKTGLPVYSLYGKTARPSPEMLQGIDTIVIDLQDVGARFYTYAATVAYMMEEASRRGIGVVVLDRPNPVNGFQIEGPTPATSALDFNAYFPMPIRHGMTLGELATLFNAENKIGAALTVVPVKGWRRDEWFDQTGLAWANPSPNMRNLIAAAVYPGIGAIEGTNVSVGRGTDTPFEQVGAPWIDAVRLARELNDRGLDGIRFYPVSFTPTSSIYAGEECRGVFLMVMDRDTLRPVRVGLEIAAAIMRQAPGQFKLEAAERLLGSRDALARVRAGEDPALVARSWAADEARWRRLRAKYLLYR